ncbi:single-stranded DNA-binding protein [Promicromonospora sukumoe]|uniref:single-stranded DNA-binding protein n=1 Tax=Promicromonospora sukumoe TaxID=88382 RepID=UPI003669E907
MNDVTVTVSGFAGNTPALHTGKDKDFAMFRVASTRRYVNDAGDWTDGSTLWFTVKAWRTAAVNLARSVRKGDPVVVTGRLELDEWEDADGRSRSGLVIAATSVGVDATKGKVEFSRVVHQAALPGAPDQDEGLVAARPGETDPFELEAEAGQRELVTA